MASVIEVVVDGDDRQGDVALALVDEVFQTYERACSRFDPTSELNEYLSTTSHRELSLVLATVLQAAFAAYEDTSGRFDPRIRTTLESLGYEATFQALVEPTSAPQPRPQTTHWENPCVDLRGRIFRSQQVTLDLGGIAKGAALGAAAEALEAEKISGLIAAGGDVVVCAGEQARPWPIAIQDPVPGAVDPVATVEVSSGAVMTSSVRVRQWRAGTTPVHHLIDPRTGLPGGSGLASVTVIGDDPVGAEVWSKTLFLEGLSGALAEAERREIAAIIVSREGDVAISPAAEAFVTWVRP